MTAPATTTMTGDEAKALLREVIERVWHRGDIGFIDKAYSPDFAARVPRSDFQGVADYKAYVRETLEGLPDIYFYIKDQYVDGDHLISRFQMTGTHTGEFLGLPPTGRTVDVEGVSIHRFAGFRFLESWTIWDVLGMCHEIGLVPELADLQ